MATKKTTVEKTPVKKTVTKKVEAEKKEVKAKATEKKTVAKKPASRKATTKKAAEIKTAMTIQFDGKSYSQEDLMNIVKDVWQYDLQMDPTELKEVELYIKPEEHAVYYIFNGTEQGSFFI